MPKEYMWREEAIDAADAIDELQKKVYEWQERACEWNNEYYELLNNMPKWISVEEQLPEKTEQVIGFMAWGGMSVLQHENGLFYVQGSFRPLPKEAVTHWMPLPEPPKPR